MKSCRDIVREASELEAEPQDPVWDEIRRHLERCPPCVEYVRQLGLTVELLHHAAKEPDAAAKAELLCVYRAWLARSRDEA